MTTHTFKNGISITLPDDISKEDLEKRWIDVTMAMSLILFYPPVAQKLPKIKITRKRKNTWKSPKPSPKPI